MMMTVVEMEGYLTSTCRLLKAMSLLSNQTHVVHIKFYFGRLHIYFTGIKSRQLKCSDEKKKKQEILLLQDLVKLVGNMDPVWHYHLLYHPILLQKVKHCMFVILLTPTKGMVKLVMYMLFKVQVGRTLHS